MYVLFRQTQAALAKERGKHLSDTELIGTFCGAVLEGGETKASGRAKYQIAVSLCPSCKQGRQEAAGVSAPMTAAAVERALCDAQHIGSLDDNQPHRAAQDI